MEQKIFALFFVRKIFLYIEIFVLVGTNLQVQRCLTCQIGMVASLSTSSSIFRKASHEKRYTTELPIKQLFFIKNSKFLELFILPRKLKTC